MHSRALFFSSKCLSAPWLYSAIFSSLILLGCSENKIQDSLSSYLARLANVIEYEGVLDVPTPQFDALRFPVMPVAGSAEGATIGLLDFLSLYGCELQVLIGHKNSGLGRLSEMSQDLLYDLKFLQLAPLCLSQVEDDSELVQTLRDAIARKKLQLPQKLIDSILVGKEARAFWKIPAQLADYPEQVGPELPLAIARLGQLVRAWLSGDYQHGQDEFEQLLAHLNSGEGGQIFAALMYYRNALTKGNHIILSRSRDLCFRGRAQFNTEAASNVVEKYFVGDVQAWAARVSKRYYEISSGFESLEAALASSLPAAYQGWKRERNRQMGMALETSKTHIQALKRVLEPCSISG